MKNTNFYLWGLLLVLLLSNYQCKCPTCPQQSNIVIDNVDTAKFMIITDNADTAYISMPVPHMKQLDSLFKYSIIIDNVDTARMRIVTDDADATRSISIITHPKPGDKGKPTQQGN